MKGIQSAGTIKGHSPVFLMEALRKKLFLCLLDFLEAAEVVWLVAPFSIFRAGIVGSSLTLPSL
jgi:hypothetical protein